MVTDLTNHTDAMLDTLESLCRAALQAILRERLRRAYMRLTDAERERAQQAQERGRRLVEG
jgi:hypothetical protein